MSTLQLDREDGGVDAMVGPWKVGGTYELRLQVRQTAVSESVASFDVISVTDETTDAAPESEDDYEEPAAPAPAPAKSGKPALTIK